MPPRHPEIARALGLLRPIVHATPGTGPVGDPDAGRRRIVVACSGGADSVALVGLLHLVADADGLEVSLAHVDHGLRPASSREADQVEALSHRLGLRCSRVRLDLAPGPGLAERARDARHRALHEMATQAGATALALGHTATDQAETVLLNLCRGAGLPGLSGMDRCEPAHDGRSWVIRPLLDLTRPEARSLAVHLGLPFVDDPTNEVRSHPRVAVRLDVLPMLESLRPHSVQAIAAAADRIAEAEAALQRWTELELAHRRRPGGLRVRGWAALPRAIRSRVIRAFAQAEGVDPEHLGRRLLEQIDRALHDDLAPRGWDVGAQRRLRLGAGGLLAVQAAPARDDGEAP